MTTSASGEPPPADQTRSSAIDELWDEVRVEPVKIALPGATVGYTLRAYRPADQLTPTEVEQEEDDPFAEAERARQAAADELDDLEGGNTPAQAEEAQEAQEPAPEDFADERGADEEVPIFLSHRGRLLLFGTPASLVSFVNSGAPHDLAQLDTWEAAAKRMQPADIAPTDQDTYELDLVVENLRGGHDAWDLQLLISAGELARDLGWALRLEPVMTALSTGSPLDDLDEALRAATSGGIKGMMGRRRLRRIGAQQASLGWRTIISKISGAVDWHN